MIHGHGSCGIKVVVKPLRSFTVSLSFRSTKTKLLDREVLEYSAASGPLLGNDVSNKGEGLRINILLGGLAGLGTT